MVTFKITAICTYFLSPEGPHPFPALLWVFALAVISGCKKNVEFFLAHKAPGHGGFGNSEHREQGAENTAVRPSFPSTKEIHPARDGTHGVNRFNNHKGKAAAPALDMEKYNKI